MTKIIKMAPAAIKSLRKRLGLSADAFAAKLGLVGKNRAITVWRWQSGAREPSRQAVLLMKNMDKGWLP